MTESNPGNSAFASLGAELAALAEKYASALSVAPRNGTSDVADGIASTLHILVETKRK